MLIVYKSVIENPKTGKMCMVHTHGYRKLIQFNPFPQMVSMRIRDFWKVNTRLKIV